MAFASNLDNCASIESTSMKKRREPIVKPWQIFLAIVLVVVAATVSLWFYLQNKTIPVLEPQGAVGLQERNLIIFTSLLSVIVVVPVFIMLGSFAWRYREGNNKARYTPDEDGNKWLETLWWGIPIVIIGILGTVTVISTHQLDPYKPLNSKVKPLNVQVVALQWKWLFIYPSQHVASLNELKIPTGTPVNFYITADAPMSAFWIPSLGTQVYAMTGMTSQVSLEADKAGTYRGTNSNINGKGYAGMHFNVDAISAKDFNLWTTTVANERLKNTLDWSAYGALAKPTENNPTTYYQLTDDYLYDKVVNKYMTSGEGGSS